MKFDKASYALRLIDRYGYLDRGRLDADEKGVSIAFYSQPDRELHDALLEAGFKFDASKNVYR